ncbi:MAG: electron-transfer flavoprotein:ubiquinone oxidoreductase [Deltaproteobacteria bacterium]|nr:electron-transfer flavoprotein:ubiquinone oxidoreductase [Deltaproteobacteria bacterium]
MNTPSQYPPPFRTDDFIAKVTSAADKQLPVGVLIVGAGPAGLACAIRLGQLLETAPEIRQSLGDFPVAVLEKGKYPGAHLLSGAVINPIVFKKLFPNLKESDFPFYGPVKKESVYFLTETAAMPIPVPPTMKNHGNFTASLSKVGMWLGKKAEELGVTILPETSAVKLLVENGAVQGVRTGDKGRDRTGAPLSNFEEGVDMLGQVTVLAEGTQGHLTQTAIEHFKIRGENPQIYALGVKEVWEIKQPLDRVIHTMGWPLRLGKKYGEFGGSFVYPYGENKVCVGLVVGLDYHDANLSVHDLLQKMKLHPLFKKILEGGKRLEQGWGAKTIPEGGFYSLPRSLNLPGAVLLGDAAGFVNVPALKGIHYAMESGFLAAESIFEALKAKHNLKSEGALKRYDIAVQKSFIWKDLKAVRNMRQAFQYGFFVGGFLASLMTLTKGLFPGWRFKAKKDSDQKMFEGEDTYPKADNKYIFDKLSSAYASGNRSKDNQPNHIRVAMDVPPIIGETWIHMCPAAVYEWHADADGSKRLQINPSNCIHCGAITAKGGRLTPPEGGSGPEYTEM